MEVTAKVGLNDAMGAGTSTMSGEAECSCVPPHPAHDTTSASKTARALKAAGFQTVHLQTGATFASELIGTGPQVALDPQKLSPFLKVGPGAIPGVNG